MEKMKSLTLQGITFEVTDEQARNDIQTLSDTIEAIPTLAQPDLAQNDPTQPDYVKNRTHWEETTIVNEPLNLEFTSMDGLEKIVQIEDDPWGTYYKISDAVMTTEQVKKVVMGIDGQFECKAEDEWDVVENEGTIDEFRYVEIFDNVVAWQQRTLFFVFEDNVTLWEGEEWEVTFPTKGIYVGYDWTISGQYTFYVNAPEAMFEKTVIHKIDKKWLPNTVLYADDTYLYHDAELTTKVSREELLSIGIGQLTVVNGVYTALALDLTDDTDRGRTTLSTLNNTYYTSEYNPK